MKTCLLKVVSQNTLLSTHVITDRMILKINAETKPSTTKLSTSQEQIMIIRAFITRRNNPSVSIVTGKARSLIIGLMKVLSRANTTATITSVVIPSEEYTSGRFTPGVSHADMPIAMHDNNNFTIKFIVI